MSKVIGVRIRQAGKLHYFLPAGLDIKRGDFVIVETARGVEYGRVVQEAKEIPEDAIKEPLKKVIRIATEEDHKKAKINKGKAKRAYQICKEKIQKHNLDMKLIDVEYVFDNKKILFYFTADKRVDFRELVKDLASVFRTRIELRQVGVRDETKMIGGIGVCGRPLCCNSYLCEFAPVSIRMAKEQNMSLNSTKISGCCGRLMCCLKNEQCAYEELNSTLPDIGETVKTFDGFKGEVVSVSVLRQKVKIVVEENDEREIKEYSVQELKFKPKKKKFELATEEIQELKKLEDKEEFRDDYE